MADWLRYKPKLSKAWRKKGRGFRPLASYESSLLYATDESLNDYFRGYYAKYMYAVCFNSKPETIL